MFISINTRKYTKFLISSIVCFFSVCYGGETEAPSARTTKNQAEELPSFNEIVGNDFAFINEKGAKSFFSDLKGKVTLVVFSTTWCPNCPVVLKSLDILRSKLLQQNITDIEIIALNIGDEDVESVKAHYAKYGIKHLAAYKSAEKVNYIEGVPVCFVFDKGGRNVSKYLGWHDFASDDFLALLKKLTKENHS